MTSQEHEAQRPAGHAAAAVPEPAIRLLLQALGHDAAEPTVAALHVAVCEHVQAMRDAGAYPEVVLARMKQLTATTLNDASPAVSARTGEASALVARVGQWCIAEYFRKS